MTVQSSECRSRCVCVTAPSRACLCVYLSVCVYVPAKQQLYALVLLHLMCGSCMLITYRIWDWAKSGECVATLEAAHGGETITCLAVQGKTLVSGSYSSIK